MRWTEALEGVRVIKFRSVLGRYQSTELNQIEAAELLGITERTFRRWCVRFEADGEAGLLDRRLGKASPKRVPRDSEQEIERLYRTRYFHGQAFSRAPAPRPPVHPRLHLDQGAAAIAGFAAACHQAWCPSAQAATPPAAGHDAASGRLTA